MTGIAIAQLMRLHHSISPDIKNDFYAISVPLSAVCQLVAIIVALTGAQRFLKVQKSMALGWALSGGWEIIAVGGFTFAVRATCMRDEATLKQISDSPRHLRSRDNHHNSQGLS